LLRDRHSHVSLYAALDGCPDLCGLTKRQASRLLRALPPDRLSTVTGWSSASLSFTRRELAALPPALLLNASLHGVLLTRAAEELLEPSAPELVANHRDADWCERHAVELLALYARAAPLTPEKLERFMRRLQVSGVGWAEDLLVTDESALRVIRASPWSGCVPACWAAPEAFRSFSPEARAWTTGFKLFADGALALRTAALSEPYLGGGSGLLLRTDEELALELAALSEWGKPLAIHAIGGKALNQVLKALERCRREGAAFPLVRIEHAQFIGETQARRARELGVVLSMQPNFSADSRDYADRLCERLRAANNPFRMLIDRVGFRPGQDLVFGSDGMPHGAEAALEWGLSPLYPGQRLTRDELLAGYA